jgi:hypothetical protein
MRSHYYCIKTMKKERKGEVTEKENHKGVGFRV